MTDQPDALPTRGDARWIVALALIIIAAAGLRSYKLSTKAFGFDELFSVHFATARGPWETALPTGQWMDPAANLQSLASAPSWWHIWTSMGYDTHPPLHAIALRAWLSVIGEGDLAARSLSVLFSLACILLLFDAARLAAGSTAGLWAAGIATVMASQIQYAQEVRSYIMLAALTAAMLNVATRLLTLGPTWRRTTLYATLSLAAMLTHYFAIGVIFPVAIIVLICLDRAWRFRFASACLAAAVLFAVAWGPFFLEQRGNFAINMGWLADDAPGLVYRSIRRAAVVPIRLLFDPGPALIDSAATGRGLLWTTPLLLLIVPTAMGFRRPVTWVFVAGVVGPIALVAVADVLQHRQTLNLIRYTLPAGVGLCGLLATAASSRSKLLANLLPAAAVLGCLGALPRAWDSEKPPWRELVNEASRDLTRDDAVVLLREPGREWAAALVYMAFNRYAPAVDCPAVVFDGPASAENIERLRQRRNIIILSEGADLPTESYLPGLPSPVVQRWIPYAGGWAKIVVREPAPATATSPATER